MAWIPGDSDPHEKTQTAEGLTKQPDVSTVIANLKPKDPSPWNPHRVAAKIFVTNLGKIDSTSNEFEIAFTLQMLYHDPHLLEVEDPELEERSDWDDPAWLDVTPAVQRYKDLSIDQVQIWVLTKAKLILREYKARGTVVSTLDLHSFPFDTQELKVTIESDAFPAHALEYVDQHEEARKARKKAGATEEQDSFLLARDIYKHAEFSILRADVSTGHVGYDFEVGGLDPDQYLWSRYELTILVHRRVGHYISKLGAVLVLSMLLSMAAHAFPVEALSDRLGLITTVFLTVVAFQFLVADSLPKIPYWTTFDWCLAFVYLILVITMFETVVLYLAQQLDPDAEEIVPYQGKYWQYNVYCVLVNLVFFLLWILAVSIIAYRSQSRANRLARPIPQVQIPPLPKAVNADRFVSA